MPGLRHRRSRMRQATTKNFGRDLPEFAVFTRRTNFHFTHKLSRQVQGRFQENRFSSFPIFCQLIFTWVICVVFWLLTSGQTYYSFNV